MQKATGTGGAVPIRNDKGEVVMQKVKVQRYVAGKRPKYAPESDSEQEMDRESEKSEDEDVPTTSRNIPEVNLNQVDDRRLKRLMDVDNERRERPARHRQVAEPVILEESSEDEDEEEELKKEPKPDSDNEEEQVDEDERMRKRLELKKKALQRQEELMVVEDEQKQSDGSEESDETDETDETNEEYSDSDDGEIAPRLKPVASSAAYASSSSSGPGWSRRERRPA